METLNEKMAHNHTGCVICGAPLIYKNASEIVKCAVCGKEEETNCACENGHFVCNDCHRQKGIEMVVDYCSKTASKNPIEIAMDMMDDESIFQNGPEHHTLDGAALLAAYKNAGGEIEIEPALKELCKRSSLVPGGTCGFWGVCGAATSAGQFWSIVTKSSPLAEEPWAQCQELTSRILGQLAELGGPRCCKRNGFTGIQEAVKFAEEKKGVQMDLPEKIVCHYFRGNKECIKKRCPYFPKKEAN